MPFELHITISNHLEILADAMADRVATPFSTIPPNPLQPETILVQSKGMQRWVSMAIAKRNGICANIDFPFPNTFLEQLYSLIVGPLDQQNAFDTKVLTFRIMALLPQLMAAAEFAPIRSYLKEQGLTRKQFQLAAKIADVFDQYQIFRPEMILGWEAGQSDKALSENAWQPVLWKKLTHGIQSFHRAAMQKKLVAALTQAVGMVQHLPPRISVFGISHLPPFHLQVLAALSHRIPVCLFLLNPCRHFWGDIVSDQQWVHSRVKKRNPELDPQQDLHIERGNRLLASWGEQGKQFFNLILQMDGQVMDLFEENTAPTLLAQIQQDILDLNDRSEQAPPPMRSEEDTSLQVHACHSPMREVEVLHDQLRDLFEKDPVLMPRDILVMTPDIGTYAPYIHAVFGNAEPGDHAIPYTVADQGMPSESRLIEGFLRLLELYQSRFEVSQVMALLAYEPIRNRFGLQESDLPTIETWLQSANIRWAWDATHRKAHTLPRFKQNTWRHGLDRLVLGYAMAADDQKMFAGMLPLEGVDTGDSHILGALANFVERLYRQLGQLPPKAAMPHWHATLLGLLDVFFATDESSAHDMQALRDVVDGLAMSASAADFTEEIPFEVVCDYLKDTLNRASFGTGFMAGSITFCAMLPMRSIPAKVICLLGLGYDTFPKELREPAFNLIAANPRAGDRSKRDDDKYLFLEALISARQVLYLSYVGASVQDNSPIPPSVVIDELLEYVEEGFGVGPETLVTRHPLQAFSRRYFDGTHPKLFSYSRENVEASQCIGALGGTLGQVPPFFDSALEMPQASWRHCTFEQLGSFYANPTRFLLEQRLGIYLRQERVVLEDQENFNLEALDRYKIRQKLLKFQLTGRSGADSYAAFQAAGLLPHGTIGQVLFKQLSHEVDQYVELLTRHVPKQEATQQPIDLIIGPFRLSGMLDGLYGEKRVVCRLAKTRPQDLLSVFVAHLAMGADPANQFPTTSWLICQDAIWQWPAVSTPDTTLGLYLDLFWDGLQSPVPFFPRSSYEYALQHHQGKSIQKALAGALDKWQGHPPHAQGESQDPYLKLCFGGMQPLTSAFEEMALKVFQPLLALAVRLST
jgi:exodeoxyribonuclease V gamma subunit